MGKALIQPAASDCSYIDACEYLVDLGARNDCQINPTADHLKFFSTLIATEDGINYLPIAAPFSSVIYWPVLSILKTRPV